MKVYKIYFDIFGKKMKTKVQARDENHVEKIEPETELDFLKKIFAI